MKLIPMKPLNHILLLLERISLVDEHFAHGKDKVKSLLLEQLIKLNYLLKNIFSILYIIMFLIV
jgi:hypothetical protein